MTDNSSAISRGIFLIGALILGSVMTVSMVTNPRGGIAALVPFATVLLALISFVKPRIGLFCLAPLVIWVDELKRLAVYFGGISSDTVTQTLAMPFVVLAALNCGFFVQVMFERVKLDRIGVIFYALAGVLGAAVYISMDGGLAERGQRAANIAGYLTLVPIAYSYLRTFDEWRKYFALQVFFATPAALWAIKQYYFGFDQIEWEYARSGLSRVHSSQMLAFANPRVFGFFGSASALGCLGIYCAFSWWHAVRYPAKRLIWAIIAVMLSWVLVISTQRTALIYPLIVFGCAYAFRTRLRVSLLYIAGAVTLVAGIISSDYLLEEGLDEINRAIAVESGWGSEVLKVSTFSDRLRGWQRLNRADSWSMFGTEEQLASSIINVKADLNSTDYNHDQINKILINYGAVGLIVLLIPVGFLVLVFHRVVFLANTRQERNDAAFVLALALPTIFMGALGGDNLNTNPMNIQLWTCFAGVIVIRQQLLRENRRAVSTKPPELIRGLQGAPA